MAFSNHQREKQLTIDGHWLGIAMLCYLEISLVSKTLAQAQVVFPALSKSFQAYFLLISYIILIINLLFFQPNDSLEVNLGQSPVHLLPPALDLRLIYICQQCSHRDWRVLWCNGVGLGPQSVTTLCSSVDLFVTLICLLYTSLLFYLHLDDYRRSHRKLEKA